MMNRMYARRGHGAAKGDMLSPRLIPQPLPKLGKEVWPEPSKTQTALIREIISANPRPQIRVNP